MSKTIDNRVVQMRFNNKQFESGAKQTLSTLERLKNALKFSKTGDVLAGFGKSASKTKSELASIADSVSALEKRFSFLGETTRKVANTVRDSLVGTVGKAADFVTESIVSGGIKRAMNIENAHYQLQALLKDEAKVQQVMDNAMESVDGTAYAFDEAAKASAMFAASGIKAGPEMVNALKGIVGTAAMTNSEFERISLIFTSVAGQGRLMGDQLLQLSSLGLNAPATIAEFFNGINDGSKKASDAVMKSVKEISGGKKVVESDIREMVSDGEISFKIFAEAMYEAFGESAEKANETFTGAMSNIKAALARIGAEFVSPLVAQNSAVVKLFNAIREKVNDVKKALTFDKEAKNVEALSKRFTDSVLGMAKSATKFVSNLDIASGMKVFYNVFDSIANVVKGFGSILAPIAKAFADVFLSFKVGDVIKVTGAIKDLTEGFKLSKDASKNLHDAFEGIFSVCKLVVNAFVAVLKAIFPINQPIVSLSGGVLALAGSVGRMLTAFTEWISQSKLIGVGYDFLAKSIKVVMSVLSGFINLIVQLAKKIDLLKVAQVVLGVIGLAFQKLGEIAAPYVAIVVNKLKELAKAFAEFSTEKIQIMAEGLYGFFEKLKDAVANFNLSDALEGIKAFGERVKNALGMIGNGDGFHTFVENLNAFGEKLKESFRFDDVVHNIETFKSVVQSFVGWFKDTVSAAFGQASFGGALAGAGGVGIIYSIINLSKSFNKAAGNLNAIPKMLGAVSKSLDAYSEKLKAEAIKKVATAILILAAALVVLSFTDTEKVIEASIGLSAVSSALLFGTSALLSALSKVAPLQNASNIFARGVSKSMRNLTAAVKWKALGSAFKDFGLTIVEIAGSIIAIALMYRKDPKAMEEAEKVVAIIAGVVTGMMVAMNVINNKLKGSGGFMKSAIAILALSTALGMCIGALKKIFEIELPQDWGKKLGILIGLLGGLGTLAIALGTASRIAAGNKISTGPILALSVLLYATVSALTKVFNMNLPSDWKAKMVILVGMFTGLETLIIAVGAAAKLAGGTIKAAGTLLSLAVVIGTITAALMILSVIPAEGMLKGAVGLSSVLMAVATGMYAASKIANPEVYKTVLAMAVMVGSITAALGVLSMVPIPQLAVSAAALGAMLLALAVDLNATSKISNEKTWQPIVAMMGVLITITGSLVILAQQPWQNMLAAGTAMGLTMTAFGIAFRLVADAGNVDIKKIALFLTATLAVIPIGAALYLLAEQPWEGMAAAGAALGLTVTAFGVAFSLVAKAHPDLKSMATFLAASLAMAPIAAALYVLAEKPWQNVLAAATALSEVLIAMGVVMKLCTSVGSHATAALKGLGLLDLFLADFALVLVAFGKIFEDPAAKKMMAGGASILAQIGNAIGSFVGNIIGGALSGITDSFPKIGKNLSAFMESAQGFFDGARGLDEGSLRGVKYMAQTVLILTGADILQGLTSWLTGGSSMEKFGKELVKFGPYMAEYAKSVKGLDASVVKNSANAAKVLADMASQLPNSGGLAGKIFGENNLSDFGKELKKFGPFLADYSKTVATVDGNVVENSAKAAKVLADMAAQLPNSGGLAAKIFGDNNLSDFGKELKKFGPLLADYSKSVSTVDGNIVEKSAKAAKVLADMANTLPNAGGLAAKIFGDNTLSEFGAELKKFGPHLAAYAKSVQNVDGKVVTASANAAKVLAELAKGLPNSGGLVSFFTGDNDMGSFGEGLEEFGKALAAYYKSISGIDAAKLTSVTEQVKKVIAVVKTMDGIKSIGASQFTKALETLAKDGVKKFIAAFDNSHDKVKTAINKFINAAASGSKSANSEMKKAGEKSAKSYESGLKGKTNDIKNGAFALTRAATAALQQKVSEFRKKGEISATAFQAGMTSKKSTVASVATRFAEAAAKAFGAKKNSFQSQGMACATAIVNGLSNGLSGSGLNTINERAVSIGRQIPSGVATGMNANMGVVREAASQLAAAVDNQIKADLEIHSPSRVGRKRGQQYDDGMALGIKDHSDGPRNALHEMIGKLGGQLETMIVFTGKKIGTALGSSITAEIPAKVSAGLTKAQQAMIKSNEWTLKSESEYWKKLLEIKKAGADGENYQNMSITKFRKEMLRQSKEIAAQYNDELDSLTKSLMSQVSTFSEVDKSLYRTRLEQAQHEDEVANKKAKAEEKNEKADKQKLQNTAKNVKSIGQMLDEEIRLYEKYEHYMRGLNRRLKNTNIWDEIKELGVESLPIIKEIYQMTDDELQHMVDSYDTKLSIAEDIAAGRLRDLRKQTQKEINALYDMGNQAIYDSKKNKMEAVNLEEQYWTALLAMKKTGADKEKYASMEIKEFRKAILAETKELVDGYTEQLNSTRDSIMSQSDIFSELQQKAVVSKKDLQKILDDQVKAYQEYSNVMTKLSKRLKGTNILKVIEEMGVDSIDQLKEINSMTDEELTRYSETYDRKLGEAGKIADYRLGDIRKTLKKQLKELWGTTSDIDIDEFLEKFDGTISEIENQALKMAEPFRNVVSDIKDTLKSGMIEAGTTIPEEVKNIVMESGTKVREAYDKLNNDTLSMEDQYWTNLLETKRKGAESEKFSAMELSDFRKHILDETQSMMDSYNDQLKSMQDSLMSQMNLFTEVQTKQALTKEELQGILNDQVAAYREYGAVMEQITTRLQGTSLLKELQGLGVDSVEQLKVIAGMTDTELTQYANTYDVKLAETERIASTRLTDLKTETGKKLSELWGTMGDVNMDEFITKFDGTLESIEKFALDMQTPFQETSTQIAQNMTLVGTAVTDDFLAVLEPFGEQLSGLGSKYMENLSRGAKEQEQTVVTTVTEIKNAAERPLEEQAPPEFQNLGNKAGGAYSDGIKDRQTEATSTGESLGNSALAGLDSTSPNFQVAGQTSAESYTGAITAEAPNAESAAQDMGDRAASAASASSSDFYSAGSDAGQGYVDGLRSQISAARAAAEELANVSATSTEEELEIHSPSRRFGRIAQFAGIGFINEFLKFVAKAGRAGSELGEASVSGAENSLAHLRSVITDDMIKDPVIRPELDLSDVESSAGQIQQLFNRAIRQITLDAQDVNLTVTRGTLQEKEENPTKQKDNTREKGGNTFEFIQNNYSPKALSRTDIYRQTNNQFKLFRTAVSSI